MEEATEERNELIYFAELAQQAERYDEMAEAMKKLTELEVKLTIEERNLLSLGYRNVVFPKRASWRILSSIEVQEEAKGKKENVNLIIEYKKKVEAELYTICTEIMTLVDNYLIPSSTEGDATVFSYKMKGDYYRYIAEIKSGNERDEAINQSLEAYENMFNDGDSTMGLGLLQLTNTSRVGSSSLSEFQHKSATTTAKQELPPSHPIRLGLALNFSVFYYEIIMDPFRAYVLARAAFYEALPELDFLGEESYKDTTLIMKLLSDNLTLWLYPQLDDDEPQKASDVGESSGGSNAE